MESFVVFDTETTGLPTIRKDLVNPSLLPHWDKCRIVQIAWQIYKSVEDTNPVSKQCYVITPDGFDIPDESARIHGINSARATEDGISISAALRLFFDDITTYEISTAVAHNMAFDSNALVSEIYRLEENEYIDQWNDIEKYCTMRAACPNGERWPKLIDLYNKLIGPTTIQLHHADGDTQLCAEIYRSQLLDG